MKVLTFMPVKQMEQNYLNKTDAVKVTKKQTKPH